jgi:hypothetical protein
MRLLLRILLSLVLIQSVISGATLMVASSGIFSSGAPTTTWSKASVPWSFSFDVSSTPTTANSNVNGFDVTFSNFSYQLNGSSVATTPVRVRFFVSGFNGGFNLEFQDTVIPPDGDPQTGFEFSTAAALFSGPTSSPTMQTGPYTASAGVFFASGMLSDSFESVGGNITVDSQGQATPEPATLATAVAACAVFAWMCRRRKLPGAR